MISASPALRLEDYLAPGACYHVARVTMKGSGGPRTPHTHEFPEVFWVEEGEGVHVVNDEPVPLQPRDVVLVRPHDRHLLRRLGSRRFTIVNLAFPSETLTFLRQRYFADEGWPWQGGSLPARYRVEMHGLDRLGQLAAGLVAGPASRLRLERVLLELLAELAGHDPHRLPVWLDEALRRLAGDRAALARGVAGLAAIAGRSREHVNRTLRAVTGRTATQTVNEIRLVLASRELRMTDRPIARIAADCGLANLSHFYRLFRDTYGTTPRQYRIAHQGLVRGTLGSGRGPSGTSDRHEDRPPAGHGIAPAR